MIACGAEVRALWDRLKLAPRRMFFSGTLPDRNELDESLKRRVLHRGFWLPAYRELKARHQSNVVAQGVRYKFERPTSRVLIACNWREPDRRRDPDNIASAGRKILIDALKPPRGGQRPEMGLGLIHCDRWHCIVGGFDFVTLDAANPGVEVVIAELQLELPLSRGAGARGAVVDLRSEATP